ncbi:MAG TPA: response regulator transcription factor [Natronosporangium sp.]
MRVLLVDDDIRFATALTAALRRSGYEVEHAATASAALAAPPCDLILLDVGLPDGDGIEVCRRLRQNSDVAIIMLTARGEERSRVIGLRSGADDYVSKPFGFAELHARMEAVLRRVRPRPAGARTVGRLRVDLDKHQAYVDGRPLTLTRKEFQLLAILAAEPEVAVRRDRLLREVWQTSWRGVSRTLDVHMATLRQKIGDGARIETIRGVGYRLVAGDDSGVARCADG